MASISQAQSQRDTAPLVEDYLRWIYPINFALPREVVKVIDDYLPKPPLLGIETRSFGHIINQNIRRVETVTDIFDRFFNTKKTDLYRSLAPSSLAPVHRLISQYTFGFDKCSTKNLVLKLLSHQMSLLDEGFQSTKSIYSERIKIYRFFLNKKEDNSKDRFVRYNVEGIVFKQLVGSLDERLFSDSEFMIEAVKICPGALYYASDAIKKDAKIVIEAVQKFGPSIKDADFSVRHNREVALAAVKESFQSILFVGFNLRSNRDMMLSFLEASSKVYPYVPKRFFCDEEFLKGSVLRCGTDCEGDPFVDLYLRKLHRTYFQKNKETLIPDIIKVNVARLRLSRDTNDSKSIERAGRVIADIMVEHINKGDERWDNLELVAETIKYRKEALKYVSQRLKNDKEFVMKAVRSYGLSLEFAGKHLKKDIDVVRAAMENRPRAIEFADDSLRDNEELLLSAIAFNHELYNCASKRLKDSIEFKIKAVKVNRDLMGMMAIDDQSNTAIINASVEGRGYFVSGAYPRSLTQDKQTIIRAINNRTDQCFRDLFESIDQQFQDDHEIAKEFLKHSNSEFLRYLPARMKSNEELVRMSVIKNGENIKSATEELKSSPAFMASVLPYNGMAIRHASGEIHQQRDLVMMAVSSNGLALKYLPDRFKKDQEVVTLAVRNNGEALEFADEKLKRTYNVVRQATDNNMDSIKFAYDSIRYLNDQHDFAFASELCWRCPFAAAYFGNQKDRFKCYL